MQSWLVLLYYAMLALLCVFIYYVLGITWWSSFNLSLLLVFVTIVFTTPEISLAPGQTSDAVFLFLLALLAFAAPFFIFVYVVSQALQDQVDRTCFVEELV
jgi:hypothetical protein